ncbi:MAG: hypothetical protein ABSH50_12355 [Bryobacteraceae bacterium]
MKLNTNVFAFPGLPASVYTRTRSGVLSVALAMAVAPSAIWGQRVPLCTNTATTETCLIDNFTSPGGKAGKVGPITSGNVEVTQTSAGAVSGSRQLLLSLGTSGEPPANDEFNQSAQVQVIPSKTAGVPSALVASLGYKAFGALQGVYGDSAPMSLNLSGAWGIRLFFDGVEAGANLNFEVWNPGIWADCGINVPEDYATPPNSSAFTVDFPESQITGFNTIDWTNITSIVFEVENSASFAITSIQAIPESVSLANPATYTCSAQPAVP